MLSQESSRSKQTDESNWWIAVNYFECFLDVKTIISLASCNIRHYNHKWKPAGLNFESLRGFDAKCICESGCGKLKKIIETRCISNLDFSQCCLMRDSCVASLSTHFSTNMKYLCFDFCHQLTDISLKILMNTYLPCLECITLRCVRSKQLIGEPAVTCLSNERWPMFHRFSCAFTNIWLQYVGKIVDLCIERGKYIRKTPKLDISGSWASKILLEKCDMSGNIKEVTQAVYLRSPLAVEKFAKKAKSQLYECCTQGGQERVLSLVSVGFLNLVKSLGDELLINVPCHARAQVDDDSGQSSGWTYLMCIAIENRDVETSCALLKIGAKVDTWDYQGKSPIYIAAQIDSEELVQLMIDAGAPVDPYDLAGPTAIKTAIENESLEVVQMLLKQPCHINYKAPALRFYKSPLFIACEGRSPGIVKQLLKKGADVNWHDANRYSPPLVAYQQSPSSLPQFLSYGAGKDPQHRWILSDILTCAILKNDIKTVSLLIDMYSDLLHREHQLWSYPHIQAARLGRGGVLKLLIEKGCKIETVGSSDGYSCLHASSEEGHLECAELIMDSGADLNRLTLDGMSSAHLACLEDQREILEALMKRGSDPNLQESKNGETPLMFSIRTRNELMALSILTWSQSLDYDTRNRSGKTALMYAIYFGQYLIADQLLLREASVHLAERHTPFNLLI
eukprot:GHVL01023674.1.p1 GENE.GHVL01023674.1~~GHVL01023674.1.p1  ORF type:complete len:680 (+),score=126.58 GHVL01023674.1:307-2346(+)